MPEGRLERTRRQYPYKEGLKIGFRQAYGLDDQPEECLVHVPPCVRVDGEWRRQGLPEGQIEVRDGVIVRDGNLVKK